MQDFDEHEGEQQLVDCQENIIGRRPVPRDIPDASERTGEQQQRRYNEDAANTDCDPMLDAREGVRDGRILRALAFAPPRFEPARPSGNAPVRQTMAYAVIGRVDL